MKSKALYVSLVIAFAGVGCNAVKNFDATKAIELGAGVYQATTVSEDSVKQTATLAAAEMDSQVDVAGEGNPYSQRLERLVQGLTDYDGLTLNYKVYLSPEVNAFAMADGTVRVYSGLLDAMPDDQVLAVIGHEIGHVKLRHSYKQMRETLLTNVAFQTAVTVGGVVGELTQGQLGQLAHAAVTAKFSQTDELESDTYAVKFLQSNGHDPRAMKRAIETLQAKFGAGGDFLSSHPSNEQRIEGIERAIQKL